MIYVLSLSFHQVNVICPQATKFYVIGVYLHNSTRLSMIQHSHSSHIYNRNVYWLVYGGMGRITEGIGIINPNNPCNITSKVHLDYNANTIKKYWKKYKKNKKAHKQKWIVICQEIKAFPGRGIDYFAGKERFENNLFINL